MRRTSRCATMRFTALATLNGSMPMSTMRVTVEDRKSTRLNSSHLVISYAVFCLKKKTPDRPLAVMVADWPTPSGQRNALAESQWADLMALVRAARTLRADYRLEPARWIDATVAS